MKKFNVTDKIKIWILAAVGVLLIGMIFFGIFGLNQTADLSKSYEIDVSVYTYGKSATVCKDTAERYFDEKNINDIDFSYTESSDQDDKTVCQFVFSSDVSEKVDVSELEGKINEELKKEGISLSASVDLFEVNTSAKKQAGKLILVFAIAIVAIFVYLFFMEKFASAVAVICSGVLSVLFFVSLLAITRIPVVTFVETVAIATAFLTVMLSSGMVARFKEEEKKVSNSKSSSKEIADTVANASLLRYIVVVGAVLLTSLLLIIIGGAYLKFLGLQILCADLALAFASFVWTPIIWALLKNTKKSSKKVVEE